MVTWQLIGRCSQTLLIPFPCLFPACNSAILTSGFTLLRKIARQRNQLSALGERCVLGVADGRRSREVGGCCGSRRVGRPAGAGAISRVAGKGPGTLCQRVDNMTGVRQSATKGPLRRGCPSRDCTVSANDGSLRDAGTHACWLRPSSWFTHARRPPSDLGVTSCRAQLCWPNAGHKAAYHSRLEGYIAVREYFKRPGTSAASN